VILIRKSCVGCRFRVSIPVQSGATYLKTGEYFIIGEISTRPEKRVKEGVPFLWDGVVFCLAEKILGPTPSWLELPLAVHVPSWLGVILEEPIPPDKWFRRWLKKVKVGYLIQDRHFPEPILN
jgi:hypothetical protein